MGEQGVGRGVTGPGGDQAGASVVDATGEGPEAGWREVAPGVRARGGAPDRLLLGGGVSGPRGASADSPGRVGRRGGAGWTSRLSGRRGLWALAAAVFVVVMGVGVVQRGPTGASVAANPTSLSSPSAEAGTGAAGASEAAAPGEQTSAGATESTAPESAAPESDEGPSRTVESPGPAGASAVPSGSSSAELGGDVDWWSVLGELDARRSAAIESLDLAALDAYALVDSPAWRADAALITDLQQRGLRPAGLSTQLIAVEEAAPIDAEGDTGATELVIVDRREAYTLVDPAGDTVQAVPAAESRRWRMVLQPGEDPDDGPGWLVRSVEEVT